MTPRSAISATLLLAGALLVVPAQSFAQGEHGRRAGAELLVLLGDLRRLRDDGYSAKHKSGLRQRILGSIAGLDLMLRLSDQETGRQIRLRKSDVSLLRRSVVEGALLAAVAILRKWSQQYPLHLSTGAVARSTVTTKDLHVKLCASCHDEPNMDVERPAFNLFKEAKQLPADEFFARMLVGVRGDRITGIDNPLTDAQIQALTTYYRNRKD